ncbi:MAG: hypothetical protein UMV23_00140 [Halanaerobium sp.]|nr:hypothetical protein [Halanaerobium sp.]
MEIEDIRLILKAEILVPAVPGKVIERACGSDLMSDVLAFTKDKTMLLTGLTTPQVVRTAEMLDLPAIVFVRGKRPEETTIELARKRGIPLLRTEFPMYEACGLLYKAGIKGCSEG